MHELSHAFLKNLLETPSASGFEQPIQEVVRAWARHYADEVRTDRHGNVIAVRYPARGRSADAQRVMLAGHCDQIALMVQHIDDQGFLYVQPIGGWDMQILLGQALTVWTRNGPINGLIARKATHLLTNEERNKVPQFTDVWVDIGARDGKEAREVVAHGDPVTPALGYRPLRNHLASSPAMDDKVGLWVVMETLRLLHGRPLEAAVYCVSTVQEEIGLRGATTSAYGINPTVGIAVDVCHATDTPGNEKKQLGEIKLGDGPVIYRGPNINPQVFTRLHDGRRGERSACRCGVPRATGTDANALQLTRDGVRPGWSTSNRYMHSPVEVVHLDDLDRAAQPRRVLPARRRRPTGHHDGLVSPASRLPARWRALLEGDQAAALSCVAARITGAPRRRRALLPPRRADAPAVARLEAGETERRPRRRQVVARRQNARNSAVTRVQTV
ncbi:MAG: M42 family metallopeptidase [Gemmataceae bacterium]